MSKSSIFFGQPIYGQLIKSLDREKIVEMSREYDGEKYVKSFDGYKLPQKGVFFVLSMYKHLAAHGNKPVFKHIDCRDGR